MKNLSQFMKFKWSEFNQKNKTHLQNLDLSFLFLFVFNLME